MSWTLKKDCQGYLQNVRVMPVQANIGKVLGNHPQSIYSGLLLGYREYTKRWWPVMSIKDIFLKKIFLIVLTASILGVAVINFFIYPSFTKMLIANTESEAITIGRHIARIIFREKTDSQKHRRHQPCSAGIQPVQAENLFSQRRNSLLNRQERYRRNQRQGLFP